MFTHFKAFEPASNDHKLLKHVQQFRQIQIISALQTGSINFSIPNKQLKQVSRHQTVPSVQNISVVHYANSKQKAAKPFSIVESILKEPFKQVQLLKQVVSFETITKEAFDEFKHIY